MEKRRELTPEEREMMLKQKENCQEEKDYLEFQADITQRWLDGGLYMHYLEQVREHKSKLNRMKQRVTQLEFSLDTIEDQLKNGIRPREEQEE